MARISTYRLDDVIRSGDLLLGSSLEGQNINGDIYKTRNYRLSDLAVFFSTYDADIGSSLLTDIQQNTSDISALDTRLTTAEGTILTNTSSISNNTSSISTINTNIQNRSNWDEAYSWGDHDGLYALINHNHDTQYAALNHNHDSQYASLSHNHDSQYAALNHNHDSQYAALSHNHDERYYTETEVDSLLNGYLTKSTNLSGLANVSSAAPSNGQVLKWNSTASHWEPSTDLQSSAGSGITLGDLSVSTQSASSTPSLTYDDLTGLFSYTPPLISNFISLSSLSIGAEAPASGNGGISYNDSTGVFTYTPPDFSGSYLPTSGGTITNNLTIGGLLTVNGTGTSSFGGNVSITGNLSVSGAFTIGTATGDLRGDVYSIVGNTSSVKVLESGSGSTPDAYFIGDLRNSQTDQVFDTSTATFRKDVSIGLSTTSTNNLNMHGASKIWFDEGIALQEQYIDKVKVSQWDASILTSSKFQMGQTTGTPPEDLIQFNINGASGLTSSLSIKPGTYISASTDTDNHVLLDVNNTTLANLYVGKTGGQSMQGPLSITAGNLTVSGNGTFIEGDGKIDIYDTSATPVKILDHINGWFKGNIRGGDLQDVDGNGLLAFTQDSNDTTRDIATLSADLDMTSSYTDGGSNTAYRDLLLNQASLIKFGANIEIDGTSVGNWNTAYDRWVRDIDFSEPTAGNIAITLEQGESGTPGSPYTRALGTKIQQGDSITLSTSGGALTIGATIATDLDDGLVKKSQLSNYGVSALTTSGTSVNGSVEVTGSNGISVTADPTASPEELQISADDATVNNKGVVILATETEARNLSANASSNKVITLQTLNDALGEEISIPSLQQVLDSSGTANTSTTEIKLAGTENANGMLLVRRNDTTGSKLISTFDTFSSQGYIQVGSQISGSQDYGYIGHDSNGLHLSKISGTGSAIVIDSSDDVSMGGDLSVSGTLTTTGAASLDGGITVDTNFSVDGTNGNVSTSGTLSSGNTTITGTLGVSSTCNFQDAVTANSLTVTNTSTLSTISLSGNITPSTNSARSIGTNQIRFLHVYTDNLNGVNPSNFANKGTSDVQTFTANVVAPDFQLTSDERLKENIIDLKPRKINVDFKEYNFKDKKQTRFGVVAQELEKHHPEFIKETELGYKSVSYIDLLVAKIVELEDRIKQLENA